MRNYIYYANFATAATAFFAVHLHVCSPALGEVGYAMRGDTRPFHNWDSVFNEATRAVGGEGLVWQGGRAALRPHLGFWFGYDDNVFFDSANEVDDTYFTIAPGLLLIYGSEENNYVTANYEFEDTTYTDESSEDFSSHLASLGVQLRHHAFILHLSDQLSNTRDVEVESAERVERLLNTAQARLGRETHRKTSLEARGLYETVQYDASGFVDYDEYAGGLDVLHSTWPKTQLFVGGTYGVVNMKDDNVVGDADYVEVSGGIRGRPFTRTTVQGRVGYEHREFDDDIESIDEWTALIGASRTLWRDSEVGVNVTRRLLPSSQVEGVTRVASAVAPYFQHILLHDLLAVSLNASFENTDYYDRVGETDRNDDRYLLTGILDLRVISWITIGGGYTYEEQDSNAEGASYTRNLVFVRALGNY